MSTQIAQSQTQDLAIALMPQTAEQLWKFSVTASKTDLVPAAYKNRPENCYIAITMGLELGFKPMQALMAIAIIKGKPSLYGDGLMALCRSFKDCEHIVESFDQEKMVATCSVKRRGQPEQASQYSVEDAKKAKLWGKQGPWSDHPKRMLQMRARGFILRDVFADVLMGLISAEEAMDYPNKEVRSVEVKVVENEAPAAVEVDASIPEPKPDRKVASERTVTRFFSSLSEKGWSKLISTDEIEEVRAGVVPSRIKELYTQIEKRSEALEASKAEEEKEVEVDAAAEAAETGTVDEPEGYDAAAFDDDEALGLG